MAFGQGFTGLIVALIVAFTSGVAFIICFREFVRELFSRPMRFDKSLRRNRNILLDDAGAFAIEDDIFQQLVESRTENSQREWRDPSTYLFTMLFLGIIAAAGFVAGLSHFV